MFSNQQVASHLLPRVVDISYTGLHKEYLYAQMISQCIFWAVILLIVISGGFMMSGDMPSWIQLVILISLLAIAMVSIALTYIGFRKKQYALRERDIIYRHGVIWRSNTVIPFNRVQHAEVSQGPLDRLFNLSRLRIYTAGGSSSDLSIPGLLPYDAERIKHFILNRTVSDEEE